MATVTWLGGTSTDISNTANWSGGAFPGTGDTALWAGNTTYAMASGTAPNAITNLIVAAAVTQSMGTSSGTCTWHGITGYAELGNRAENWFACDATTVQLNVSMPNNATCHLTTGTTTTCIATSTTVDVGSSAVVTYALGTGATYIFASSATAVTYMLCASTVVKTTSRSITSGSYSDGSVVTLMGTAIIGTTGTHTSFSRSTLVHQSSGTLPTSTLDNGINILPGSLMTPQGNPNGVAQGGTVVQFPGGTVMTSANGVSMNVSTLSAGPAVRLSPEVV